MPPSYSHSALGTLRAVGITHLEFWCVHLPCTGRNTITLDELIERCGPATGLVMLARRARCGMCGKRGAHVQEAAPPAPGAWAEKSHPRTLYYQTIYRTGRPPA